MSTQTHNDAFTDVLNNLLKDLSRNPSTIIHLLVNNVNSPVLADIQTISLFRLNTDQMTSLLPVFSRMTGLLSLALPLCDVSSNNFKFLFTECSALSKLQSLDFTRVNAFTSNDLLALSESTTVTNLTSLTFLYCGVVPQSGDAFTNFGSFGGATTPSQGSLGLIALLSSPVVKNLTHLHLNYGHTYIGDSLIHKTIATSPYLSNLVSLDLSGNTVKPEAVASLAASTNRIHPEAIAALAASTTLSNLTSLKLGTTWLGDEFILQLLSPPSLLAKKLQSLNLHCSSMTSSALQKLLQTCPRLSELILDGTDIGPTGAEHIAAASMPHLTKLSLAHCGIFDDGYLALAQSTTLSNLRELNLYGNKADPKSIITLINSPVMANLTSLDLGYTHEDDDVLTALAQSATQLQHLHFCGNGVCNYGVVALSKSTTLTNLARLDLSINDIGPVGVKALCTSPVVSKLKFLDLSFNVGVGHTAAVALAAPSSTLYNLLELSLMLTDVNNEDLLQLLSARNLDQLDSLQLLHLPDGSAQAAYRARFETDP